MAATLGISYERRRARVAEYFDRTAAATWAQLTSDAPVSAIRRTVRAGRDRMRATLLGALPPDLHGARVLDAGCGTGALAVALAERGARVLAIDLSPTLVALAEERTPGLVRDRIAFRSGDMLDPSLGTFDHVVAMDSLIHYEAPEMLGAVARLADRARTSLLFTVAPRTPLLAAMHAVGRLLPRGSRAPAIEPVAQAALHAALGRRLGATWTLAATTRVASGFYTSQAIVLRRPEVPT
ncbi:MAG: magnesium protoporphyrin IX methyltransferase [Gemmatirosa sp.]|nr:magnesium protoporphyrin IX methyltransferase [Gemmatirosa sp.]